MQLRPLALGAILSALAASSAAAQGAPQATASQGDLGFGAQVLVLYDTNSARTGKSVASQRGLVQQEVTVTPTVTFNLSQPVGQQSLFLSGNAGYQLHQRNKALDRQTYVVNGGGVTSFGMCQASVSANFRAAQADIQDLDPLTTKNLRSSVGQGVSLQCGRPSGLGANVAVQRSETKNSEQRLRVGDSDTQSITGGVGYSHPTLGSIGVSYVYDTNTFPNRTIPGRPIGDGYFTESFGLTGQRSLGRLSVSLAASRFRLKREFAPVGTSQTLKGTTYGGQATLDLGTRISLSGGASRSIQPSGRPGKLYDISKSAKVGVSYQLGSRFDIKLDYAQATTNSNRDTSTPLLVITDARLSSTSASINFAQSSKLSLGLSVRYDDRQTNLPQFDYTATTVGFRAGTTF